MAASSEAAAPSHSHVVIIAGGSGTRFWPRSSHGKPKQLLKIWDERTLLEHTVDRFQPWPQAKVWVVTTEALVEPSRGALGSRPVSFLGEPEARNTAPCILWSLLEIAKQDPEAVVSVVPADHFIGDEAAFRGALAKAMDYAGSFEGIITLGIRPNRPETGYGYIQSGATLENGFSNVTSFVEKPQQREAYNYVKAGNYLWNAGIFVCRAKVGLKAFEKCMPELYRLFSEGAPITDRYRRIRPEDVLSIDFGVMERAQGQGIPVAVMAVDFAWSDLGSYTALEEIDKAVAGNVVSHNSASNIVQCDKGLVALLGVNDLVVVKDGDVVLVATKDRCQDIRKLVERVRKEHPEQA